MPRLALVLPALLAALVGLGACQHVATPLSTVRVDSTRTGTGALLIGLDAAPGGVVWTAGARGRWARSLDGGRTWTHGAVPGADTLQFRDVEAVDANRAVLLSIGAGTASRVYTTDDGGASWALRWTNPDPRAFYDCMAFNGRYGLAVSDAVQDAPSDSLARLPLIETHDGGHTWADVPGSKGLRARPGAGAFASSGTCVVASHDAFLIATNRPVPSGAKVESARVSVVTGRGARVHPVPIASADPARGVATMAVTDAWVYVGLLGSVDGVGVLRMPRPILLGQIEVPWTGNDVLSRMRLGRWEAAAPLPIDRVYGLAASRWGVVATGPDGLALSTDDGATWRRLVPDNLWSVTRLDDLTFLAVGQGGRAVRLRLGR